MRFIKKEHIITTVFNKDVESSETIRVIFNNLHKYQVEFSVILRKFFQADYDYRNTTYDKVRVVRLHDEDDAIDILVLNKSTVTNMNNIAFSDIVEVKAITMKNHILDVCDDLTRWDILDI